MYLVHIFLFIAKSRMIFHIYLICRAFNKWILTCLRRNRIWIFSSQKIMHNVNNWRLCNKMKMKTDFTTEVNAKRSVLHFYSIYRDIKLFGGIILWRLDVTIVSLSVRSMLGLMSACIVRLTIIKIQELGIFFIKPSKDYYWILSYYDAIY